MSESDTKYAEKRAETKFDINHLLTERWSPRAFSDKIPSKDQLLKLLEAARWAPSSFNEQPWRFIIGIKNEGDSYQKVFNCLNEFNQEWAQNAPVLMLVCAKKHFSHTGKPNRHNRYDCGAAMANFTLQATEEGLHVHQMAGIHPEKGQEIFDVPDDFEVVTGVALGYAGDPDILSEKNRKSELAERQRKELNEISFIGDWGKSFHKG